MFVRMILLVTAVLSVAGCGNPGPKLVPVRGQVTYQGRPLTTGNVMFVPEHGPAATGVIDTDGRYAFRAVVGTYQVAVMAMPAPSGEDPMISRKEHVAPKSLIPTKYNRYNTSGITVVVEPGKLNDIDIQLLGEKGAIRTCPISPLRAWSRLAGSRLSPLGYEKTERNVLPTESYLNLVRG